MNAIEISQLKKVYRGGVEALKGIDLTIKKGDFFALLGPNGAGKSTTIGALTQLVTKTSGRITVMGHDTDLETELAKSKLGIVPQEFNFNIFEKVIDIVVQQAGYYGVPRSVALERAEKVLKELSLWEKRNAVSRSLSGGMKRRLMIARALIHEPEILILDEPTAGVDVELRRGMWDFLTKLNKKGVTILLTTHYLEEAELLCNNIAIIDKGKILVNLPKKELLSKLDEETYVVDVEGDVDPAKLKCSATYADGRIEVNLQKGYTVTKLIEELKKQKVTVLSIGPKNNRLEEIFVRLTK